MHVGTVSDVQLSSHDRGLQFVRQVDGLVGVHFRFTCHDQAPHHSTFDGAPASHVHSVVCVAEFASGAGICCSDMI